MAVTSKVERQKKRVHLQRKYDQRRKALKLIIVNMELSDDERMDAVTKLQALPRDSSRCRQRSRCSQCGRSRGYNRLTGLCRIHMRIAVMAGIVPGMHKASW